MAYEKGLKMKEWKMRCKFLLMKFCFLVFLLMQTSTVYSAVKYEWHAGHAILKSGLHIEGEFQFKDTKNTIPHFLVKDSEISGVKRIDLPMFESIKLLGAERGASAMRDSTEWVWIEEYKDLMRVVREGDINLYDNSRIVNEKYDFIDNYQLIGQHPLLGVKTLDEVSDLNKLMRDRPYFMESAKVTGKLDSKDYGVILFLVDLYNDQDPLKYLQWREVKIETLAGETKTGHGLLQPVDIRNECNTGSEAYLHFYDGKDFELLDNTKLKSVTLEGTELQLGYYGLTDKHFYGMPWEHEGSNYVVPVKVINKNRYLLDSRKPGSPDYIVLQEIAGTFRKPQDEIRLRKLFLEQNQISWD